MVRGALPVRAPPATTRASRARGACHRRVPCEDFGEERGRDPGSSDVVGLGWPSRPCGQEGFKVGRGREVEVGGPGINMGVPGGHRREQVGRGECREQSSKHSMIAEPVLGPSVVAEDSEPDCRQTFSTDIVQGDGVRIGSGWVREGVGGQDGRGRRNRLGSSDGGSRGGDERDVRSTSGGRG